MIDTNATAKDIKERAGQIPPEEQLNFVKSRIYEIQDERARKIVEQLIFAFTQPSPIKEPKVLVVPLHGIRTDGTWQEWLRGKLAAYEGVEVAPVGYHPLDIFRFLSPFIARKEIVDRVKSQLRAAREDNPHDTLCIIAHSFATYVIADILRNDPDIKIDRLIFAGSIVDEKTRWETHRVLPEPFVNDCGFQDIYPVLASNVTWGFGASGRFGFKHLKVKDRFHAIGHDGFFTEEFVEKFWIPFVLTGEVVPNDPENSSSRTPYFTQTLYWFPFKTIAASLLLLFVLWVFLS